MPYRIEKDALGSKKIPAEVYYGIQTARALENFPISGWRAHPHFLEATVLIKKAAALSNSELKLIPVKMAKAIVKACDEILGGGFRNQFVVDVFQAGAGTSHNMNVNEVLANRANELLGQPKGSYKPVHPNDHVNRCQSTNDVIPTAIRLAALQGLKEFLPILHSLVLVFQKKAKRFDRVIKSGRTHLQDATPIRLGQEFSAYSQCLKDHQERIQEAKKSLWKIGLGGTAVGTGINTHPHYQKKVLSILKKLSGENLKASPNLFEAMQSFAPFVNLSNSLRNLSLDLIRIANDLRLLSSGPNTGLAEISLPALQPGSSIMPGKVNPVMAEMLDMVCFFILGLDESIALASQAGQLELNVMLPLVAYSLPWSLSLLSNSLKVFAERCVQGIQANVDRCSFYAENSTSIATVLAPVIGYAKTAEIVKEAIRSQKPLREILKKHKILSAVQIEKLLRLFPLTNPS